MLRFPHEHWHLYWNPSKLSPSAHTCSNEFYRSVMCYVQKHFLPLILPVVPFNFTEFLPILKKWQRLIRNFWLSSSVLFILYTPTIPPLACRLSGIKNSGTVSLLQEPFHRYPCTMLAERSDNSHQQYLWNLKTHFMFYDQAAFN